jgi:hypothetical protein
VVSRPKLNEFLSACVKQFTVYIWSSAMKRNFSRHLEIIVGKFGIRLLSSKIINKLLCFRIDHFLPEKPNKPIFNKNLLNFFVQFRNKTFENTLLIDKMPNKSLFNPPFNVIFSEMFYESHSDVNYLFQTVLLYLESCICPKSKFINL